jgi:tryptophan synthase beta chain
MTPLVKMHTLGHDFIPDPIHAGGLRYHGMSPLLSHIYELGPVRGHAINQTECFERAVQFARTEGIIPAPEPTHAIAQAIREAERCKETGEEKVILTALCGHGHFDMAAYDAYFRGELEDYEYPEERCDGSEGCPDRAAMERRVGWPVIHPGFKPVRRIGKHRWVVRTLVT